MDHRAVIANLGTDQRRDLCKRSDAPGLIRFGLHLSAIVVLAVGVMSGGAGWPVALFPLGVMLLFLFTALHECTHKTAFRTEWLNSGVAWLAALVLILGPTHFRYFHLAHHKHTHDREHDPENPDGKPRTLGGYLVYLSGIPDWTWRVRTIIGDAVSMRRPSYIPPRARSKVRLEAIGMLLAYTLLAVVSVAAQSSVLIWIWLLPMIIAAPTLRAYLLAEHAGCPHDRNMFRNTRSILTNPLVRWIAWNMPYHAEHHAYPAVPFHKLPALHNIVARHLETTEPGYRAFHRRFARRLVAGTSSS